MSNLVPVFAFFSPGPMEMMMFSLIALLLFGKRLPEVARSMGKGIVEFKKGINGIEDDINASSNVTHSDSSAARPVPAEERDEVTAPKFTPPTAEPQSTETSAS